MFFYKSLTFWLLNFTLKSYLTHFCGNFTVFEVKILEINRNFLKKVKNKQKKTK